MKKIKLKICNANLADKFSFGNFFLGVLRKYYQVELSDNPDYVIYNDSDYEYLKYDCVRICFTGENISHNFNLCDYALGFDYMTFGDRYYRLPLYLVAQFYSDEELAMAAELTDNHFLNDWPVKQPDFTKIKPFTREDLAEKTGFCSFVYSNYLADPKRAEMFEKLSSYKKVDSGGAYLNNVGGRVKNKLAFDSQHKFSMAFENSSRSGYVTDRLPAAIMARTIPLFWGNPEISKEFNEKRFINCHSYENFDQVLNRVKEIDQNDMLYLEIINQPVAALGMDYKAVLKGFEEFLRHIIDQPLAKAKRRSINAARAAVLEASEAWVGQRLRNKNFIKKQLARLYHPFKTIGFLERLKQKILAKQVHGK